MSQVIDIKLECFHLAGSYCLQAPAYTHDKEMVPKCEQDSLSWNPFLMSSGFYNYSKFFKSVMLVRAQEFVNIQLFWHRPP